MKKILLHEKYIFGCYFVIYFLDALIISLATSQIERLFSAAINHFETSLIFYTILLLCHCLCMYFILMILFWMDKAIAKELFPKLLTIFSVNEKYRSKLTFGDIVVIVKEDTANFIEYVGLVLENIGYIISVLIYLTFMIRLVGIPIIWMTLVLLSILFLVSFTSRKSLVSLRETYLETKAQFIEILKQCIGAKLSTQIKQSQIVLGNIRIALVEQDRLFKINIFSGLLIVVTQQTAILFELVVVSYSYYLILTGKINYAAAFSMFVFANIIFYQIQYFFKNINEIRSLQPSITKINTFLNQKNEKVKLATNFDTLEIDQINLVYNRPIFVEASLQINAKEKILLVGNNGSGKSSLIKMLLGDVGECRIKCGKKILPSISSFTTYVHSNSPMFMASFFDNITLFNTLQPIEHLFGAKTKNKIIDIQDVVDCTKLSGGEKQIVALIQCLNQGKQLIILDEFESSLNKEVQMELMDYLTNLPNQTIVMISHHLSDVDYHKFNKVYHVADNKLQRIEV